MSLKKEVEKAKTLVKRDGYDMSLGELLGMYDRKEILIQPAYQRLYRWDTTQKSRFIESLLLGIPIPPIFVATNEDGKWELIDGLQRLSTLLQFTGRFKDSTQLSDEHRLPFICEGTHYLPALNNKVFDASAAQEATTTDDDDDDEIAFLEESLRLAIMRARIRVEILESGSDKRARFELFQRLNTGGSPLSEQEVRTSVGVSINAATDDLFSKLSKYKQFSDAVSMSDFRKERQYDKELVMRFIVMNKIEYDRGIDVHDYLTNGMMELYLDEEFDPTEQATLFKHVFRFIHKTQGDNCFRRPKINGSDFTGNFSLAAFECCAVGLGQHFSKGGKLTGVEFRQRYRAMWEDATYRKYSRAGVRGTERLHKLVFAKAISYFSE